MISNPTPLPLRLLPGRMFLGMRGKKEGRNNIFSMEYVTGCLTNGAEWKVISGIIALLWLGEKGRNRSGSFGFSAPLPHPNKVRSFLFLQLRRFRVENVRLVATACQRCVTQKNSKEYRLNFFFSKILFHLFVTNKRWKFCSFDLYFTRRGKDLLTHVCFRQNSSSSPCKPARHLNRSLGLPQPDYSLLLYRHSYSCQAPLSLTDSPSSSTSSS